MGRLPLAVRREGLQLPSRWRSPAAACSINRTSFTADRAGVFNSRGGTNTLAIRQNWGYYDVDYLRVPALHAADAAAGLQPACRPTGQPPHADADELPGQPIRPEDALRPAAQQQRQSTRSRVRLPQPIGRSGPGDSRQRLHRVLAVADRTWLEPENETEQTIAWAKADRRHRHR